MRIAQSSLLTATAAILGLLILLRIVTNLIFLPRAGGSLLTPPGGYLLTELLLAMLAFGFNMTGKRRIAAALGGFIACSSLYLWWFALCKQSHHLWGDFDWLVVPELCFAAAALLSCIAAATTPALASDSTPRIHLRDA